MKKEEQYDILLVEDDSADAELVSRILAKQTPAVRLLHLQDSEEALAYLFAEGSFAGRDGLPIPAAIFLDLKMPKITGLEILKRIKSDACRKMIPVILLTSSREDKDITDGYRLGANSYIVKPVDFESLAKKIAEAARYWILINQSPK